MQSVDYQDRISKIELKKLLPVSVAIFLTLIFLLFLVAFLPGVTTIILATLLVSFLVIAQAVFILKDKG